MEQQNAVEVSREEQVRQILLEKAEPRYGALVIESRSYDDTRPRCAPDKGRRVEIVSDKIRRLMEIGAMEQPKSCAYYFIRHYQYDDDYRREYTERTFFPFERCDQELQQEIRKKEQELRKIQNDPSSVYDQPRIIEIPLFSFESRTEFSSEEPESHISIEVTPRELAEAGILYTDFRIEEVRKSIKTEIADACREANITNDDIFGKLKRFMDRLIMKRRAKDEKSKGEDR